MCKDMHIGGNCLRIVRTVGGNCLRIDRTIGGNCLRIDRTVGGEALRFATSSPVQNREADLELKAVEGRTPGAAGIIQSALLAFIKTRRTLSAPQASYKAYSSLFARRYQSGRLSLSSNKAVDIRRFGTPLVNEKSPLPLRAEGFLLLLRA